MKPLLALGSSLLLAFVDDASAQLIVPGNTTAVFLGTVPDNPIAGLPYLIRASSGPCESISANPDDVVVLSASGTATTVEVQGVFSGNCSSPMRDTVYALPPISQPGTYSIALQMNDAGDVGRLGTRLVTVVAPGSAQAIGTRSIPAANGVALGVLILGLMGLTLAARRTGVNFRKRT